MPELPEVETIKNSLLPLIGCQVLTVDTSLAQGLVRAGDPKSLLGDIVLEVWRHGKWIQIVFHEFVLSSHLGMFGTWSLSKSPPLMSHERLRLVLCRQQEEPVTAVYRDMRSWGKLYVHSSLEESDQFLKQRVGIDALEITEIQLYDLLSRDTRPVASFLMDQSKMAGVGNIYRAEILHRSSIHPSRPCTDLLDTEISTMLRVTRRILREAIEHQGSTVSNYQHTDGQGSYQTRLSVYGQAGEQCIRCGDKIVYDLLDDRKMYYCPECQL